MARSLAEQLREHREAFVLAQELRITPKAAAEMLRKRRAQESEAAALARMAARDATTPRPIDGSDADRRDEPWMMRD